MIYWFIFLSIGLAKLEMNIFHTWERHYISSSAPKSLPHLQSAETIYCIQELKVLVRALAQVTGFVAYSHLPG